MELNLRKFPVEPRDKRRKHNRASGVWNAHGQLSAPEIPYILKLQLCLLFYVHNQLGIFEKPLPCHGKRQRVFLSKS